MAVARRLSRRAGLVETAQWRADRIGLTAPVFVISDRTGTVYTFSERSSGLRYFLSYLIQTQIHRPASGRESILLMDEPDTYLSAEAQQDLMRVFRDLAEPEPGVEPIQVIYVTHSPFLLDKNHSERIRVPKPAARMTVAICIKPPMNDAV